MTRTCRRGLRVGGSHGVDVVAHCCVDPSLISRDREIELETTHLREEPGRQVAGAPSGQTTAPHRCLQRLEEVGDQHRRQVAESTGIAFIRRDEFEQQRELTAL